MKETQEKKKDWLLLKKLCGIFYYATEIAIHGRKIYLLSLSKPKLKSVIMINDLSSAIQYYPGLKKNPAWF